MKKQHHVRKYLFLITTCILVVSFLLSGCGRGAVVEKEEEIAEEEEVMISGTITYADYMGGEILLAAFTSKDYQISTPIATGKISSPGTYSIQVPINSGQVWIVANNDVNGNGKPDPDEPHGELETPVTMGTTNIQNVNITLMIGGAPPTEGALGEKVMISGTITYADYTSGEILLAAFTSKDYQTSTPIATGKISSPGTYSIQVPINSGQVWIVANNDVNGDGKPDPDEPHGELETPVTVSTINIEKVNITLMTGGVPDGEESSSAFDVLPSLISAEFADDVPEEDKALVIQGISAADFYLQQWFGKSINRPAVLRVDASEAEPNAVMENGEMAIILGTNSKAFKKDGAHMAAHEYIHVYATYNGLGSTDVSISITPLWFLEGEAEWLSYETMYEAGLSHPFEYEQTLTPLAKQETAPLKSLEKPTQTVVNSSRYALYALAVDYLMRDKPKKVLDDFAVNLADGKGISMPEAFETAFNITLDKFYEDFESYRKTW